MKSATSLVAEGEFEALESRYRKALEAFFRRRVDDRTEAEDLAQEVFLRLLSSNSGQEIRNHDAFIFRVATNLLRDRARRRVTRCSADHLSIDSAFHDDQVHVPAYEGGLLEELTPERITAGREILDNLMDGLGELEEKTRTILLLYRVENLKQREIAALLGVSVSSVEKHVVKALVFLSKRIELQG